MKQFLQKESTLRPDDLEGEERDQILPLNQELGEDGLPIKYDRPPPRGGLVPRSDNESPLSPDLTPENEARMASLNRQINPKDSKRRNTLIS